MSDRFVPPIPPRMRSAFALVVGLLCCLLASGAAFAQGDGVLTVTVRGRQVDPVTRAVSIVNTVAATIRLESLTERAQTRNTDPLTGIATFPRVAEGTYTVVVTSTAFKAQTIQNVAIQANPDNKLEVTLEPLETTVNIVGTRLRIRPQDTGDQTILNRDFWQLYPLAADNRQSLPQIVRAVPGLVYDSVNQVHARGENSIASSTYLNGIYVPNTVAGRAAQFLIPDSFESVTVRTGGFSPEFAGSGAIYDIQPRQLPLYQFQPNEPYREAAFLDGALRLGNFDTRETYLNFGTVVAPRSFGSIRRRAGQPPPALGPNDPRIRYVVSASQRFTNNALQTPQEGNQTNNNGGSSEVLFGKFDFLLKPTRSITALFNFSSGRTDVANRSGFGAGAFNRAGGGFGFAGLSDASAGLPSQAQLGQNFRQKDVNNLAAVQFTEQRRNGDVLSAAVGSTLSSLTVISQRTPTVALNQLAQNNSVEYLPTVLNEYNQTFVQLDYTPYITRTNHQYKFGVFYHDIGGKDSYQLIPQSQAALNALAQLDPRLAPQGRFVDGNYQIDQPTLGSPILFTEREGYYAGAYLQDTWRIRVPLRLNYGVRIDSYQQSVGSRVANRAVNPGGRLSSVSKTELSPRVNLSLELPNRGPLKFLAREPTVVRASYNRTFAQPNMGQGAFVGNQPAEGIGGTNTGSNVQPQVADVYSVSIEHQFGTNKVAKLAAYAKDIRNSLAVGQLITGLQSNLLAVYNQGGGEVEGTELSFQLLPPESGVGPQAFLSYANSATSPRNSNQLNNLGRRVAIPFYEYDQQDTLTLGAAYTFKGGATAGLSFYYGSGLYNSALPTQPIATIGGPDLTQRRGRESFTELNLRLSTGYRYFQRRFGVQLDVANLTDNRARMNFRGPFGNRFEQGRRFLLSVVGRL